MGKKEDEKSEDLISRELGGAKGSGIDKQLHTISSLTASLSRLRNDTNSSIKHLKMKLDSTDKHIKDISKNEGLKQLEGATSSILSRLGNTVDMFGRQFTKTTMGAARMTKESLHKYGQAIGEDISINKSNTIAMSLSQATPLFGYFAAKFMESGVYKGFTDKIQDKFRSAASNIGAYVKGTGRAAWQKVAGAPDRSMAEKFEDAKAAKVTTAEDINKIKDIKGKDRIPSLATGGYVKEEGLVNVHAGEVVAPIEKILEKLDTRLDDPRFRRQLLSSFDVIGRNMANIETYIGDEQTKKRSIAEDFLKSFKEARGRGKSPEMRMLKAILELKTALVGSISRLDFAWQQTLMKHPTFRNILAASKAFKNAITLPFRAMFSSRGGYGGMAKSATKSKNVFINITSMLSLMFTQWAPLFADMHKWMGEGKKKGVDDETYTWFDKIKEFMANRDERDIKGKIYEQIVKRLDLDKKGLERAGISDLGGLTDFKGIASKAGINKENLQNKWGGHVQTALKKLRMVSQDEPSLAKGGVIKKTGRIIAHAGEMIMPVKKVFQMMDTFSTSVKAMVNKLDVLQKPDYVKQTKLGGGIFKFIDVMLKNYQSRWEKKQQKSQEKHEQRVQKGWKKAEQTNEKFKKRTDKTSVRFFSRWSKIRERAAKKYHDHVEGAEKRQATFRSRQQKRLALFMEKSAILSAWRQRSEYKKGMKEQLNIQEEYNKKIAVNQKRVLKRHQRIMNFYAKLAGWRAKREEKKAAKLERIQAKMQAKEMKWRKKFEKYERRIKEDQIKWENKLEQMNVKIKMKEASKIARIEGKLKLAESKVLLKEKRLEMKANRKVAREELKLKRIEMKEKMKTLKSEMKQRKIDLRERIAAAKEKTKQQRKEMWSGRWKRFVNLPGEVEKMRDDAKKGLKARLDVAKQGIEKLKGINKYTMKIGMGIAKLGTRLRRMGKNTWKYILMFMGFIGSTITPVLASIGASIAGLAVMIAGPIIKALGWLGAKMGFGKIAGIGAYLRGGVAGMGTVGALGAIAGGAMGVMDAVGGVKKAKEWETSKTSAGIGGFLGGASEGGAGSALKGVAKGASMGMMFGPLGAAIGGLVGGLLGLVGGKNIAKGLDWLGGKIKSVGKAIIKVIMFPVDTMLALTGAIKNFLIDKVKGLVKKLQKIPFLGKFIPDIFGDKKLKPGDKVPSESFDLQRKLWANQPQKFKTTNEMIGSAYKDKWTTIGGPHQKQKYSNAQDLMINMPSESLPTAYNTGRLARREAERDLSQAKATAGPIVAAQEKARKEASIENAIVSTTIVNNTNAITSNTSAVNSSGGNEGNNNYNVSSRNVHAVVTGDIG